MNDAKRPKQMNIALFKLIFINKNFKIINGKHACLDVVAMATSSFRQNNLTYQITFF